MAENIVLIGFMGVGKGRVGRALARSTGRFVVDCDDLIESAMNMKIRKIFARYGEEAFRRRERELGRWLAANVSETIISTGGGFVNIPNLKAIGEIVYLHDDFETLVRRLLSHPNSAKKLKKRPLLGDLKKAKKLYDRRLPLYRETADHTVVVTDHAPEESARRIAALLSLSPAA